jgi:hypothetical protein
MFKPRGPQGQNPRTTVWETLPYATSDNTNKEETQSALHHFGPTLPVSLTLTLLYFPSEGRHAGDFYTRKKSDGFGRV